MVGIEVTLSSTADNTDVKNLLWLKSELGAQVRDVVVLATGAEAYRRSDGVRNMCHAMTRTGWQVGLDQTARFVRLAGLEGVRHVRKWSSPLGRRFRSAPSVLPDEALGAARLDLPIVLRTLRLSGGFEHSRRSLDSAVALGRCLRRSGTIR